MPLETPATGEVRVANVAVPTQRNPAATGRYLAELWCEFDCVAYVFVGDDPDELTRRLNAARAGDMTWDHVRPLSRAELYNIDI